MKKPIVAACIICVSFLLLFGFNADFSVAASAGEVVAFWENTGTNHVEIGKQSQTLKVNITLNTIFSACYNITVSSSGKVGLYPISYTIVSTTPRNTTTESIFVSNLGVEQRVEDVPISVKVIDMYTNREVGSQTVYATLLSKASLTIAPSGTQIQQNTGVIDWIWIALGLAALSAVVGVFVAATSKKRKRAMLKKDYVVNSG